MPAITTRGAASAKGFGFTNGGGPITYIEDVFSTYLYTGTGATQTITNNLDLSTKGGLTWIKGRSGATGHRYTDTARGVTKSLASETTAAEVTESTGLTAFGTTGFTIGADADYNTSAATYASWTFRKQPKFFDVVTYTGTGSNTTIAHTLGSVPGCIIVKRTDTTAAWAVYHRSLANTQYLVLNTTAAVATGATWWNSTTPTSSVFSVGTDASVNASGGTYVAYLFAHNAGGFGLTGADNVISCGSFTTDATPSDVTVTLGFEPQLLIKRRSSAIDNWEIVDNMRGMTSNSTAGSKPIYPDLSNAEAAGGNVYQITPTGFFIGSASLNPSSTNIYIAIRRGPMKVPTVGTTVYNAIARTGTGAAVTVTGVGFAPDLGLIKQRGGAGATYNYDRLRGTVRLNTSASDEEFAGHLTGYTMDGVSLDTDAQVNGNTLTYINHFFKRAPGFFDEVCYTGTGVAKTETHNLGAAPELIIFKPRSYVGDWYVLGQFTSTNESILYLNLTTARNNNTYAAHNILQSQPTSSAFALTSSVTLNTSAATYVAHLFATCAGVSKVGTYTGNGSNQTIACGFAAGSRFVMIKRTDSTGDWYVWDSVRGIVAANDPHISLNSTAAEVTTDDSVDTDNSGFIVNQDAATNINVTSATYIFLAIA